MSRAPEASRRARVRLLPDPVSGPVSATGALRSIQEAELEVSPQLLAELWRPANLERFARAYWRYLGRISLGLLRVVYEPHARTVVLVSRRLALLRFRRPEYVTAPGLGRVTWRIERGVLVAPRGRGRGYLRISVRRLEHHPGGGDPLVVVRAEVANFYPLLRGSGRFARLGMLLYSATQARLHVAVTKGFLRSLERLDLPDSAVGALREPPASGR